MRLDTKTVASLQLGDKSDQIFFDDELPRFGLRLRKTTDGKVSRNWVVQYRQDGRQRRHKLGSADVVRAEDARKAAVKILSRVHLGQDPQGEKADRRSKDAYTFNFVAAEYLADRKSDINSPRPRTQVENSRYLTGVYFRPLHHVAMDRIELHDIATCLRTIKRDSGVVSANRAGSVVAALCRWSMRNGYIKINPAIDINKYDEIPRDRVLSDAELAAIWNAASDGDTFSKIVKLLMLTGCRRKEVGDMAESEFNRNTGVWTIPASRTKNKHAHALPLPPAAWEIIDTVPRPRGSRDFLFGLRGDDGFNNWSKAKHIFDAKLGDAVGEWKLHDLRRSVATGMADIGIQPHIIETVLNHRSGHKSGVAGIYNRSSYDREVKTALALWADHIHSIANAGTERKIIQYPAMAS